jgi:hypothetical protein
MREDLRMVVDGRTLCVVETGSELGLFSMMLAAIEMACC